MSDSTEVAMLKQRIEDTERIGREFQSRVIQSLEALKVMIQEDEIDEAIELIDALTGGI